MKPSFLIQQYETFLEKKQRTWMYDLLLSYGPPETKYFDNWDLKTDLRGEVRFIPKVILLEIRRFMLNTEWCLCESMGLKVLHNHCKIKLHGSPGGNPVRLIRSNSVI